MPCSRLHTQTHPLQNLLYRVLYYTVLTKQTSIVPLLPPNHPRYPLTFYTDPTQEFYGAWYGDSHRQRFVSLMATHGYTQIAMPCAAGVETSWWANSGLAIFSPHALSNVDHVPFATQLIYDKFLVNRGVLGVTVRFPIRKGEGGYAANGETREQAKEAKKEANAAKDDVEDGGGDDDGADDGDGSCFMNVRLYNVHFGPPLTVLEQANR